MAFGVGEISGVPTFLQNIYDQGYISQKKFSFWLNK
jgi:hypothetical protein